MRRELLDLAADLARRGEPFAIVTVVARKAPVSAQAGDAGLVTREGALKEKGVAEYGPDVVFALPLIALAVVVSRVPS